MNHSNEIKLSEKSCLFNDGDAFFKYIKFKSGLVSNCVVKVSTWKSLNMEKYIGCQWIHFAYQIECMSPLRTANAYFLSDMIFSSVPVKQKWGGGGTYVNTGVNLVSVFDKMYDLGYTKNTIKRGKNVIRGGYPGILLQFRIDGYALNSADIKRFNNVYREYPVSLIKYNYILRTNNIKLLKKWKNFIERKNKIRKNSIEFRDKIKRMFVYLPKKIVIKIYRKLIKK